MHNGPLAVYKWWIAVDLSVDMRYSYASTYGNSCCDQGLTADDQGLVTSDQGLTTGDQALVVSSSYVSRAGLLGRSWLFACGEVLR